MFSETDSTRQPAEKSIKTDQQTQQAQDLTKCPIIDPCFSPRGSLDSGGGTSQTPQRVYEGLTHHRLPGSASTPCGGDISGRAFHLQRQQSRRVIPPPLQRQAQTPSSHTKEMQAPGCEHKSPHSCIHHPSSSRANPLPRDRDLTCTLVQEVRQETAHDSLVADDKDVLLPLQLHDDRLQALHQVLVGLGQKGREMRHGITAASTPKKLQSLSWYNLLISHL